MAHRVTLIPGDGTGPELAEATRRVLEATGVEFDWDVRQAGTEQPAAERRCVVQDGMKPGDHDDARGNAYD